MTVRQFLRDATILVTLPAPVSSQFTLTFTVRRSSAQAAKAGKQKQADEKAVLAPLPVDERFRHQKRIAAKGRKGIRGNPYLSATQSSLKNQGGCSHTLIHYRTFPLVSFL